MLLTLRLMMSSYFLFSMTRSDGANWQIINCNTKLALEKWNYIGFRYDKPKFSFIYNEKVNFLWIDKFYRVLLFYDNILVNC